MARRAAWLLVCGLAATHAHRPHTAASLVAFQESGLHHATPSNETGHAEEAHHALEGHAEHHLEEEIEESALGGYFALVEFNSRVIAIFIVAVIAVTIIFDVVVDYMKERIFTSEIGGEMLNNMLRELAILGFVSFLSSSLLCFLPEPGEEMEESFEFAHTVMFITAVFYAIEIGLISAAFPRIETFIERLDGPEEDDVLAMVRAEIGGGGKGGGKGGKGGIEAGGEAGGEGAAEGVFQVYAIGRFTSFLLGNRAHFTGVFKCLRFQFMARNELLTSPNFSWQTYLLKTTERRVGGMVEVNWRTWLALLVLVAAVGGAVVLPTVTALIGFVVLTWTLLLLEVLLLYSAASLLEWLIEQGRRHRFAADRLIMMQQAKEALDAADAKEGAAGGGSSSGGSGSTPGSAAERRGSTASPALPAAMRMLKKSSGSFVIKKSPKKGPEASRDLIADFERLLAASAVADESMCEIVVRELESSVAAKKALVQAQKQHDAIQVLHEEYEEEATGLIYPSLRLRVMPFVLQVLQLLQCFVQAMVLTMLGHLAIVELGPALGLAWIVATWLPTTIMQFFVTIRVISVLSVAGAVVNADHDVLDLMQSELTLQGDYSAAADALEVMAQKHLTEAELLDEELVRAKMADLIKLGEMRWRYRVVEEGQSPRDEGLRILGDAKKLLEAHIGAVSGAAAPGGSTAVREAALRSTIREKWSVEYANVLHGLGLARVIFNTQRDEDVLIDQLLTEAIELRTAAGQRAELAETLNAKGALLQKQLAYEDALQLYTRALEIRNKLPAGEDDGKEKETFIAQSLVSLGNLWIERGDKVDVRAGGQGVDPAARSRQLEFYNNALGQLAAAKEAYVRGFFPGHPKVAWALDGLGKVHQKIGNLRAAQEAFEAAIAIRTALHAKAGSKQMFRGELERSAEEVAKISGQRQSVRSKMRFRAALTAFGSPTSKEGGAAAPAQAQPPAGS